MTSTRDHWNTIFSSTEDQELGWYEHNARQTMEMLENVPGWNAATVFLPGAGTTVLVEELIAHGCKLVLNDVSSEALNRLKERLGNKSHGIVWNCQDISRPLDSGVPKVDLWVDRAVLHFLLDEGDIRGYLGNLSATLRLGGYVMFAEFSTTGAPKCAGLDLHRYSLEELTERLGAGYTLVSHTDYTFVNPFGDPRPYVYALFHRNKIVPSPKPKGCDHEQAN
ncbi:MAG: methyltransferase type 12 [Lentisphaerae bacterium RIFOXYB12_FULL_65_16]|nr:MAG: methyltransferase type 12 [Lentisphaerae bacterium RIFOXYA12_64_32]OGV86633.1 MAG: methyltransferase type 12 [Lentisphaerae bacterium RIFOXYB12_FULL_65_16]